MSQYDVVIFDMDGVLLQGATSLPAVYQEAAVAALDSCGCNPTEAQKRRIGKYHYDEQFVSCCQELGVEPQALWEARERFADEFAIEWLQDGSRKPYPDTDILTDSSLLLAIVSNNRNRTVQFVADELLTAEFEPVIGRAQTVEGFKRRKPEPYYLHQALDRLDTNNALYVGDRGADIEAAHRAGIDGAFIRREHNENIMPEPVPEYDVSGLGELLEVVEQ